ncbi:GIY-YIG nuclease family protein [Candidatus Peregrinibacteria bacterium]|nr:GIY-YIG nuclease family protein [Candidatus Peregrinibacteria bacterium]
MAFVYILRGERWYVGSTIDLSRRIKEHARGKTHTTKRIGDWKLEKIFSTGTLKEAQELERRIKRSGHIERWIHAQF